ncbi:MAG: subtilase family protein [Ramlibacter sp.]|jgi:hypothetical protein|nr:subtilase family protein [Ramlibacter sp.]
MGWSRLPTGRFTGIDWGRPGATDGFDPYLVWAEVDRFSGYDQRPGKWLPVVIELHPGWSIAAFVAAAPKSVRVREIYTSPAAPAGLRFCSAQVSRDFFRQIRAGGALHQAVKRFELGLPAGDQLRDPAKTLESHPPATQKPRHARAAEPPLTGKVIGLIDDSLALAHANFLDSAGQPRTAFFWRQDGHGVGNVPPEMGYGHELTATDIRRAMAANTFDGVCDEDGVYIALGLSTLGKKSPGGRLGFHALDTGESHGTFVLDLAAGPVPLPARVANLPPGFDAPPGWQRADDAASRCPIVAVQLDYDTVLDTSGGSMNVGVLDALLYILSRCDAGAEVTVNISFGTLAGPHDGTSILEGAMDQLVDLCGERLRIVLAAGNGYQSRTHANVPLNASGKPAAPWRREATLHWQVQPDDQTQSFLELWLPPGAQDVRIAITPPGHRPLPPLAFGESGMWLGESDRPCCALIYPRRVATGENGTCALVALAQTFSFDQGVVTAPHGPWQVTLTTRSGQVVVDAYIERDDIVSGMRKVARQSHFEDRDYDVDAAVDKPSNPSLIRRSGSFNSIATGKRTTAVGATRMSYPAGGKWALYSPRSPDPDSGRPERKGVVKMPDAQAYGDENPVQEGVTAAGTRSGAIVRLKGTSAASPQVTRALLNTAVGESGE